jgi:hypothetical protein
MLAAVGEIAVVGGGGSGELRLGKEVATPAARPSESAAGGPVVNFYNGIRRFDR